MSEVTDYVSEIEQELIDAVQFVPEKKYRKRQDYLGALIRAISDDLPDSEYDKLSDEATDWCEAAVSAYKEARELPDYPNGEAHEHNAGEAQSIESDEPVGSESRDVEVEGISDEGSEAKEKKKRGRPPGNVCDGQRAARF